MHIVYNAIGTASPINVSIALQLPEIKKDRHPLGVYSKQQRIQSNLASVTKPIKSGCNTPRMSGIKANSRLIY